MLYYNTTALALERSTCRRSLLSTRGALITFTLTLSFFVFILQLTFFVIIFIFIYNLLKLSSGMPRPKLRITSKASAGRPR